MFQHSTLSCLAYVRNAAHLANRDCQRAQFRELDWFCYLEDVWPLIWLASRWQNQSGRLNSTLLYQDDPNDSEPSQTRSNQWKLSCYCGASQLLLALRRPQVLCSCQALFTKSTCHVKVQILWNLNSQVDIYSFNKWCIVSSYFLVSLGDKQYFLSGFWVSEASWRWSF